MGKDLGGRTGKDAANLGMLRWTWAAPSTRTGAQGQGDKGDREGTGRGRRDMTDLVWGLVSGSVPGQCEMHLDPPISVPQSRGAVGGSEQSP